MLCSVCENLQIFHAILQPLPAHLCLDQKNASVSVYALHPAVVKSCMLNGLERSAQAKIVFQSLQEGSLKNTHS